MLQVRSMNGMQCSRLRVFAIDNPLSIRVNKLMNAVRAQRPHLLQTVRVVTHKDPLEAPPIPAQAAAFFRGARCCRRSARTRSDAAVGSGRA